MYKEASPPVLTKYIALLATAIHNPCLDNYKYNTYKILYTGYRTPSNHFNTALDEQVLIHHIMTV